MTPGTALDDAIAAAAIAAIVSGTPSTLHAMVTRQSVLEASLAAGTLLLPGEQRRSRLLPAAALA
ncbi:MAG: hypothetical protein M3401_10505, partial [Actinomycetota bacterium]|nr:hypothetical protein [Actinomycetota bacterium]